MKWKLMWKHTPPIGGLKLSRLKGLLQSPCEATLELTAVLVWLGTVEETGVVLYATVIDCTVSKPKTHWASEF